MCEAMCVCVALHHQLPCSLLHDELKSSGSSAHLAGLVASTVGKALRLMAEKAEYMAAAGPELRQVRGESDTRLQPAHRMQQQFHAVRLCMVCVLKC